jgi:hypothetical protein
MRILTIAFLVLMLGLGAAAQKGCIVGVITDDAGVPIKNMHVIASSGGQRVSVRTDSDEAGAFEFHKLPASEYEIVSHNEDLDYAWSNSFEFHRKPAERVIVSGSGGCAQIKLKREPRAARIRLNFTDARTGELIQSPEAQFRRADSPAWTGFVHGRDILIPSLAEFMLEVGAQGYQKPEKLAFSALQPGELRELSLTLQPAGTGCMAGTVVDDGNQPVAEARVQPLLKNDHLNAISLSATTDKEGRFHLDALHPGVYQIFVHEPNGATTMKEYGKYPEVNVTASGPCVQVSVSLGPQAARLEIEVLDAVTRRAIPHFKLIVKSSDRQAWWSATSIDKGTQVPAFKPFTVEIEAERYIKSPPLAIEALQPKDLRKITIELEHEIIKSLQ